MPRKGQDRTRLTGRLTLPFSPTPIPKCPPLATWALLQIYAPNTFTKPFFGLSAQTFPWYPISSHKNPNALGGGERGSSGMVGRAGGVGGPRRPLKRPVFDNGARQARGGR